MIISMYMWKVKSPIENYNMPYEEYLPLFESNTKYTVQLSEHYCEIIEFEMATLSILGDAYQVLFCQSWINLW